MNYRDIAGTRDATTAELIDEIKVIEDELDKLGKEHYFLYRTIVEQMGRDGATVARSEENVAKLTPKISYDSTVLARLREITDPEDLEGVYTPEHEEVRKVPERWNMTKAKKLLRLGNDHSAIIDDAKIFGNPSLKVYQKGDESTR